MNTNMQRSAGYFFLRPAFAAVFAAITLGVAVVQAEPPIFEATFNKSDDLDLQYGAQIGADGSGVSGKPGDKSYVADSSTLAAGAKGPSAEFTGSFTPAQNLDELTVTAWYKPRAGINHSTTLFEAVGTSLLWDEKGFWVWRIGTKAPSDTKWFYWFPAKGNPPLGSWNPSGQWTFFAAVWKREDKKVTFYQGGSSAPTAMASELIRQEAADPLSENPKYKRIIGNGMIATKDRQFDGNIDDLRFYSKALDLAAIEKIRQADLKNEPAP
jgi:hypothetical protein